MNFSEFLHTVPTFEGFNRQELDLLERTMIVKDFPDGHVFIQEGTSADAMYLLVDGEVVVTCRRVEGFGQDELARLHAGELFGLIALIDHGPRSATCKANGPVRVAFLPSNAFELLFKGKTHIQYRFQQVIARQLVYDIKTAISLLTKKIAEQTT